jgi:beta-lactamase class A
MPASRPTRQTPFSQRRSEAMASPVFDANRFYTETPTPFNVPPLQKKRPFTQGENPFFPSKQTRLSPLQARHKAKKTRQLKRLSLLTVFLISLSIGLWMLGGRLTHAVEEQFLSPQQAHTASVQPPLESLKSYQSTQFIHRGMAVCGIPQSTNEASLAPLGSFTPLTHPALLETQRDETLQRLIDHFSEGIEPNLRPHVLILDGQTLQFAGKRMEEAVPSASVIKLPLLYLYALHLNNGNLTNETPAYFGEHHMVSGSGDWQFLGANKFYTAFQTAEAMIQNSDNSATELMTSLLGGKNAVTQQFKELGLQQTALKNILPDVEGYNTISVYDMVTLLFNLKEQPSLTTDTKSTAMEILEGTRNRRLIPALLPPETLVAHKTGDIGKSLGETALVYLPDGRYYYLSVMVERPHNHEAAKDYIQRLSKGIWDHYIAQIPEGVLSQPKQPSKSTPVPLTSSDAEVF